MTFWESVVCVSVWFSAIVFWWGVMWVVMKVVA